ncbi:MAG TPA: ATP-binding protein [Deltaproteobacteria bacterium]|nr:ATP-binding protein [Deltaproteobacteria bacterium]
MSLVLKNVVKKFGEPPSEVIKGISLSIEDGEFVSIVGRSGSGKSTLLYLMSTLDLPSSGSVLYSGENIQSMSVRKIHEFRNDKIGFIFQFHYLLHDLNVLENILMPAFKTKSVREKRPQALRLLESFGLLDKARHYPSQISGGERQRVAIARSLIMQPSFLFADEPTGSLDSVNGQNVMKILRESNVQFGTTVVMVTHETSFAALADRQIYLADGRVV